MKRWPLAFSDCAAITRKLQPSLDGSSFRKTAAVSDTRKRKERGRSAGWNVWPGKYLDNGGTEEESGIGKYQGETHVIKSGHDYKTSMQGCR